MPSPGRKPRQITVRTVGTPADAALAAFARLLLAREQARPPLVLVPRAIARIPESRRVGDNAQARGAERSEASRSADVLGTAAKEE